VARIEDDRIGRIIREIFQAPENSRKSSFPISRNARRDDFRPYAKESLLAERGIDLVVLEQGIDTSTRAGCFLFHVLGAMDEMLADLISEGTRKGLEAARARGRAGGRKPKLNERQLTIAQQLYDDKGEDGKRKYTVTEIAETFSVSRKTIYRHLN